MMNKQGFLPNCNKSLRSIIGKQRSKASIQQKNPQQQRQSTSNERRNSKGLFITEHDLMEKTRVLWRKSNSSPKRSVRNSCSSLILKQSSSIKSWKQLERVKSKLHVELLKRKSKEEIFDENMKLINKIENIPPKIDPWNYRIPRTSRHAIERQLSREAIFEENIKLISKIENTPPKVNPWNYRKPRTNRKLIYEREQRQEQILAQNLKMIQKIEDIPPKVQSWTDLKWLKIKTERKKQRERSNFDAEKIAELLKAAEEKLKKQKHFEEQKIQIENKKRSKTLPSKIRPKEVKDPNLKNFTMKIKGAKYEIDCWNQSKTNKKLVPLGLMEMKHRQKVTAFEKLRPKFFAKK